MNPKNVLLIVDPQLDFHDETLFRCNNAKNDARNIGAFITNNLDRIDEIYVTMDTHNVSELGLPFSHSRYVEILRRIPLLLGK